MMNMVSAAHFPVFPSSVHLFGGSAGKRVREDDTVSLTGAGVSTVTAVELRCPIDQRRSRL